MIGIADAEVEYNKAIQLNPNNAPARHWFALYLAELGRFDEALQQIDVAQKLDPLAPIVRAAKGKILFVARRYDQAINQCKTALELEPNFTPALALIGQIYTSQGNFREAIAATIKYARLSPDDVSLELAYVYAAAGQKDSVERLVRKVTSAPDSFSAYAMATVCAANHDEVAAFRWLETAIDRQALSVVWMRVDPRLDNIRPNVRFGELVSRLVPSDQPLD